MVYFIIIILTFAIVGMSYKFPRSVCGLSEIGDVRVFRNSDNQYCQYALEECTNIIFGVPIYRKKKYLDIWNGYRDTVICTQPWREYCGGYREYVHYFNTPEEALQFDRDYKPMTVEYYRGVLIGCIMGVYCRPSIDENGNLSYSYDEHFGHLSNTNIDMVKHYIDCDIIMEQKRKYYAENSN